MAGSPAIWTPELIAKPLDQGRMHAEHCSPWMRCCKLASCRPAHTPFPTKKSHRPPAARPDYRGQFELQIAIHISLKGI